MSLQVFKKASELAEHAGLILADTKFEFGRDPKTGVRMRYGNRLLAATPLATWILLLTVPFVSLHRMVQRQ